MNTFSYGAFVSPHGGLGGPPNTQQDATPKGKNE
jgi:hypothetical protein